MTNENPNTSTITDFSSSNAPLFLQKLYTTKDGMEFDLERFMPLKRRLFPKIPGAGKHPIELLADEIFQEIVPAVAGIKLLKQKRIGILNIVTNIVKAWEQGKVVTYSMSPKRYTFNRKVKKYIPAHYTRQMITLVKQLDDAGYVEIAIGFYDHEAKKGKLSRIMPTNKFLGRLEAIKEANPYIPAVTIIQEPIFSKRPILVEESQYTELECAEPVQLKNVSKELIDYRDTDFTRQMRNDLLAYNDLITRTIVACPKDEPLNNQSDGDEEDTYAATRDDGTHNAGCSQHPEAGQPADTEKCSTTQQLQHKTPNTEANAIASQLNNKDTHNDYTYRDVLQSYAIDTYGVITGTISHKPLQYKRLRANLYRVFNDGSFERGGRFYGAEYQLMNESQRSRILINGNPVVELDYSNLHVRMLYHMKDLELDGDAYTIQGYEELRDAYKKMSLIAINAKDEKATKAAFQQGLRKDPALSSLLKSKGLKSGDLLASFMLRHQAIKEYFNSGIGIKLQFLDSKIAAYVLNHFTEDGIPCLCVHDSFLVEEQYRYQLEYVMQKAYSHYMNGKHCEIKDGKIKILKLSA